MTIGEERALVETNGELTGEGKKEEGIRQNEGFTRRTNIDGVTNVVLDAGREFRRKTRNPQKEERHSMKSKVFETKDDNSGGEGSR